MSLSEFSDAELLRAYVAGDALAFDLLLSRYQQPLYSWFRRNVEAQTEVDDLFQETWVRVVKHASRYKDTSFRAWIWRIARNLVIDRRRRRKPVSSLDALSVGVSDEQEGTSLGETIPSEELTPLEALMNQEVGVLIEKAIRMLPQIQREVFLLRTDAQLSFNEIAEVLQIPLNTALGRMHDATLKLRVILTKELNR